MEKELIPVLVPNHKVFSLSQTELLVLFHLALGLTSKDIATRLDVMPKSIDNYKNRIGKKLGFNGYKSLFHFAVANKESLSEWYKLLIPGNNHRLNKSLLQMDKPDKDDIANIFKEIEV